MFSKRETMNSSRPRRLQKPQIWPKAPFWPISAMNCEPPLNAILGYSQLMQRDGKLIAEHREYLNTINLSGEHLLELINDVLEISKIEARRITLSPQVFDLHVMLLDLYTMFKVRTDEKHLTFDFDKSDNLPRHVNADINKFRQIMINLLGNAVKFTEKGGIALRAKVARNAAEQWRLLIEIEDTGPGILETEKEKVFQAFEQTQAGRQQQGGTGLGLAISREYARLMDGEITFTSRVGKGSCFCFECSVQSVRLDQVPEEDPRHLVAGLAPGQTPLRILVAEDNQANRILLVKALEQAGFEVQQAENGEEAVICFKKWSPHFIWMDIRMPVLNGLGATRKIRALPGGHGVKIVALTASVLANDTKNLLASGCDEVVHKPYRITTIFQTMAKHLGVEYQYKEETAQKPQGIKIDMQDLGQKIPDRLRKPLIEAVIELDTERTMALVKEISRDDAATGAVLKELAQSLDYERLLGLLEQD